MIATQKVAVKAIKIPFSENGWFQRHYPRGAECQSFDQANRILRRMSYDTCDIGYDKTDFEIEWEDGTTYGGRYDLHQFGKAQEHRNHTIPSIGQHIKDHCEFYTGRWIPQHMIDRYGDDAASVIASMSVGDGHRKFCETVLDTLDLGL